MPEPNKTMFQRQHHNAIAKDIREELEIHIKERSETYLYVTIAAETSTIAGITNLAIKFARRFAIDNENFDPIKFLDVCSPDIDLYPLSELWDDENGT